MVESLGYELLCVHPVSPPILPAVTDLLDFDPTEVSKSRAFPRLPRLFTFYHVHSIPIIFCPQLENDVTCVYWISIIINMSYLVLLFNLISSSIQIKTSIKYRRIIYFIALISATILTPRYIIRQTFLGIFIVVFHEIQIGFWLTYKKYQNWTVCCILPSAATIHKSTRMAPPRTNREQKRNKWRS